MLAAGLGLKEELAGLGRVTGLVSTKLCYHGPKQQRGGDMQERRVALAFLGVGLVLLLLSLTADLTGIGEGNHFGYRQITGSIVGAVLAGFGAFRLRR